ncbi:MAG TPA: hypothetical protein VMH49_05485 [Thermoplasmata archaeon]|nr:hypothetical protein [Thermoplasmata archaeon]
MSTPSPGAPGARSPRRRASLRVHGVLILVIALAEVLLGNALANDGSPYPASTLYAHVGIAVLLVLLTIGALVVAVRGHPMRSRAIALVTFLATLGAALGGTIFLDAGGSNVALDLMEGLPVLTLLGAILLIVWGVRPLPDATNPST